MQWNNKAPAFENGLCRFDELRFKTDRELLLLIESSIEFGLRCACTALNPSDDFTSARRNCQMARRACDEAVRLLFLLGEDNQDERCRLEPRLESLQEMVQSMSFISSTTTAIGSPTTASEEAIAGLARALWKARNCPEGSAEEDWLKAERVLKSRPVYAH
jgi:DUF2934 family protein